MSDKPESRYIRTIGHSSPHHFFATDAKGTHKGTDLDGLLSMIRRAGEETDVYRVPLAMFSEYETKTDGSPDVDGTVFIGHWGVRKPCVTH